MLLSTQILNDMEDGISYNGDIDDLIDAIYEENREHYALEDVLFEHLPDLSADKANDILTDMIIALEELNGDTEGD